MFRSLPSFAAAAVFVVMGAVAPAQAQELVTANIVASSVLFPVAPMAPVAIAAASAAAEAEAKAEPQPAAFARGERFDGPRRPFALPALYASQIALQALDAHSTYAAINRGAYEANPLMKGVVKNKAAMMAVKAGVAASTIMLAEKMWKRGNRAGAIATMLVVNGVTAAVVANNYKVAARLR
jgi:hypothetical protein